jgi:hypothetical protein
MAPPAPQWQACGPHRHYVHGDVVFLQTRGPSGVQELAALLEPIWQVQQQAGRVFVLLDAREATPISAEQRRFLAGWFREHPIQGRTVVFGASSLVRATVALLNAAARLLAGRDFVQEQFVGTEAEAWAALREQRRKFSPLDSPPR